MKNRNDFVETSLAQLERLKGLRKRIDIVADKLLNIQSKIDYDGSKPSKLKDLMINVFRTRLKMERGFNELGERAGTVLDRLLDECEKSLDDLENHIDEETK